MTETELIKSLWEDVIFDAPNHVARAHIDGYELRASNSSWGDAFIVVKKDGKLWASWQVWDGKISGFPLLVPEHQNLSDEQGVELLRKAHGKWEI